MLTSDLFLAATLLDFRFKRFEFIRQATVRKSKLTSAKKYIIERFKSIEDSPASVVPAEAARNTETPLTTIRGLFQFSREMRLQSNNSLNVEYNSRVKPYSEVARQAKHKPLDYTFKIKYRVG